MLTKSFSDLPQTKARYTLVSWQIKKSSQSTPYHQPLFSMAGACLHVSEMCWAIAHWGSAFPLTISSEKVADVQWNKPWPAADLECGNRYRVVRPSWHKCCLEPAVLKKLKRRLQSTSACKQGILQLCLRQEWDPRTGKEDEVIHKMNE